MSFYFSFYHYIYFLNCVIIVANVTILCWRDFIKYDLGTATMIPIVFVIKYDSIGKHFWQFNCKIYNMNTEDLFGKLKCELI